MLYFIHLHRSTLWLDLHQIWYGTTGHLVDVVNYASFLVIDSMVLILLYGAKIHVFSFNLSCLH